MTLYLQINLAIAASLLSFCSFKGLSDRTRLRGRHASLLRWGQGLLLSAILIPAAMQCLSYKTVTWIELSGVHLAQDIAASGATALGTALKTGAAASESVDLAKASTTASSLLSWGWARGEDVAVLWLLGFVVYGIRLLVNAARLRRELSHSTLIRSCGAVRVLVSETVSVPFSLRTLRYSWIILPLTILQHKSDVRIALGHEIQHHRQRDTAWALLIELIVACFYVNPFVYVWKRVIIELQEFSCDEALVGQRRVSSREYGSCLVRVAETALGTRQVCAGTTCMASGSKNPKYFKSFLRRRIEMLVNRRQIRFSRWIGPCVGTFGLFLTVAFAYAAEQATREQPLLQEDGAVPNPGNVVVDSKIQAIAESALRKAIKEERANEGFAIVADPNTGKVLAIANVDSNDKKSGFWALSQRMEPASLAKAVIAAKAIDRNLTAPEQKHFCENGKYHFAGKVYLDWKKNGWESLSTEETIAHSSNICAIKVGEKLGAQGIDQALKDFGFGPNGTAYSFPLARTGLMPSAGDLSRPTIVPFMSLGFGFSSTPIEVLQAFGAIANGGELLTPQGANAPEGAKQVIRRVISSESAEKMRKILRRVVTDGTAKGRAESNLYTTAGKTATGYTVDMRTVARMGSNYKANVAQFIGFAPADRPRVEVYVGIIDPNTGKTGAHGSEHAAPVFKEIVEGVLKEMKVAPDRAS